MAAERRVNGASVVLCTLGMLSNSALLDPAEFFTLVPMERLIIDEASQIDTFEFMVGPH